MEAGIKKVLRRNLDIWLDKVKVDEKTGEGFYVYSTDDRFLIVVHLKDGSYREDQIKGLKETMGG